jgi:site-specific DNA-cytosine methylase
MKKKLTVLSLFDGMACTRIALDKLGFKNKDITYFASEVDKYAINVAQGNYPEIIQLGDIKKIKYKNGVLYSENGEYKIDKPIDLVIGGSPCFVKGTKVLTNLGYKNIEEIEVGDLVLTHMGRYKKVLKIGGNQNKEIWNVKAQGLFNIETTENHPFYVRKSYRVKDWDDKLGFRRFKDPEWKRVKDLEKGDYLGIPILQKEENPLELTQEECFILGRYLADGHTRKDKKHVDSRYYQLILSVGSNKVEKFISVISENNYSNYTHTKNVNRVVFSNKRLVEIAENHMGCGAENKFISQTLLSLPKKHLEKIIEGYLSGDGSFRKHNFDKKRATTISKNLIVTLQLAIAKVYKTIGSVSYENRPSTTIIEGRTVNQKDTYSIEFKMYRGKFDKFMEIDGIIWTPLKKNIISKKVEDVYNIEVEEDNSYVVSNCIVHNCQGFSFSGKQLNFNDPRSALFFEYVRLLKEINPKYFLLENVRMKKEYEDVISDYMGVSPLRINSNLVSAQNRPRLYWTNIEGVEQPKDKGIFFQDIMEKDIVADNFYYSDKAKAWIQRHSDRTGKIIRELNKENVKMQCLEATMHKKYSAQRFFQVTDKKGPRYITPLECEKCQTVPENYTAVNETSNTQRYRMLGNGFTVDIIKHILGKVFKK